MKFINTPLEVLLLRCPEDKKVSVLTKHFVFIFIGSSFSFRIFITESFRNRKGQEPRP